MSSQSYWFFIFNSPQKSFLVFLFFIECNGSSNSNAPKYFTYCRDAFGPFNKLVTMHEPAPFEG